MIKKVLLIILAATVMISLFACTPADGEKDVAEGNPALYMIDFRWGNAYCANYYPDYGETVIGDALLSRYSELEEKHSMNLIVEDMKNDSAELLARIAITQNVPDIFMGTSRRVGWPLYNSKALTSLDEIETIDHTSDKWGAKNFIACAKYNGKEYGFFPWEWAYAPEYCGVMLFNTDILKDAGVALPYEYQETGSWNWENLRNVLEDLMAAAQDPASFIPWTTGSFNDDGYYILMSNGLSAVEKDVNDNLIFGYDCPAGQDALNFLNELYVNGLYNKSSDHFTNEASAFLTTGVDQATGAVAKSGEGVTAASAGFEYGLVSIPYGPNGTSETVSANVFWSTPINFILNQSENDTDVIGIVMEELFAPLDDVYNWKEYCQEYVFFHDEDYDNYLYMLENCNYDYSVQLGEGSNLDGYFGKVITGEMSAAEAFDTVRNAANAAIKENIQTID